MFEDKHIFKFVCAILAFASIIIPGPIVPIISLIIAISMLVYKIKRAKESPEGFAELMIDIALIIIVLVIDIGFFAMRISIENEFNKYNYSSTSSEEMTTSDIAETVILAYKLSYPSQFKSSGNYQNAIKSGFISYLKNELEVSDVSVNGNRITCSIGTDKVTFTVTKNNIEYSVK